MQNAVYQRKKSYSVDFFGWNLTPPNWPVKVAVFCVKRGGGKKLKIPDNCLLSGIFFDFHLSLVIRLGLEPKTPTLKELKLGLNIKPLAYFVLKRRC